MNTNYVELLLCGIISILVLIDGELWYLVPIFFLLVCLILRPIRWLGMLIGLILEFGGLFVLLAGSAEWNEMLQAGDRCLNLLSGMAVICLSLFGSGFYFIRKYYLLKAERKYLIR